MIERTYTPPPPLGDFVDFMWLQQGRAPAHRRERVMPTGTVEMVIALGTETLTVYDHRHLDRVQCHRHALICGPHTEYFVIDTAQQREIMGVHFRPGGAAPFLGLPADQVRDQHLGLEVVWGRAAGELHERLLAAGSIEARFRVVEQALLARVRGPLARHPAVAFALREFRRPEVQRVAEVTDRVGLSARRFIQLFSQEVGLTPKRYCRVQRFQEVLQIVHPSRDVDWIEVALSCGYYDQAHFNHDFRAFSGLTPSAYFALRGDQVNHVPLFE